MQGPDGDDEPLLEPGVQGRRVHRQRSRRSGATSLRKTLDAIDLGAELGASVFVMWGGREGVECDAAKDVRPRSTATRRRSTSCCAYIDDRGYDDARSRSSRSRTSRAATCCCRPSGTRSRSSTSSSGPTWSGSTRSSPTRRCRGLSFHHAVAQTLWADKLFHIDLNGQVSGKYDQDFRFGSEGIRDAFYLVKLLEDAEWDGMRHFDAHAYRTEDADGVWDFARGCMRTYLILKEKAQRFARGHRDPGRARSRARSTTWPSRRFRTSRRRTGSPRLRKETARRRGARRAAATATSGSTSS